MKTIVIIDYQSGNLHSVERAIRHTSQHHIKISNNPSVIEAADAVVFPGQGAAKQCMEAIDSLALRDCIRKTASDRPFLGICMGLEVLMEHSEEDEGIDGLGLVKGNVKRFAATDFKIKIPHIGWNTIEQTQKHRLWHNIENHSHFYFVHSYYVQPEYSATIAGTTEYGNLFCSVVAQNQLFAIQAHPEKSGVAGLQLLSNFSDLV